MIGLSGVLKMELFSQNRNGINMYGIALGTKCKSKFYKVVKCPIRSLNSQNLDIGVGYVL